MKAKVTEIQVGGVESADNLYSACLKYVDMADSQDLPKAKINFTIELPDGKLKSITIRDEDNETVAYGDFEGLPNFLDYAKEVLKEEENGNNTSNSKTN